ncbi:MAG TPA: TatD family hydrolase [Candidatus Saccharimonadales bacterium]|nr:TatD family hydrolase [Candidatus Saccharimonadales bacterium]
MLELIDTHCHIHFPDYPLNVETVINDASKAGVTGLMCVGCTLEDSRLAIRLAEQEPKVWASIGLHPHEAKHYVNDQSKLQQFRDLATKPKVVAIGEAGLDYFYEHSSKDDQVKLLRYQLDLAAEYNLPMIFHIRDAFDDFWPIFDKYQVRGVIHSFSATQKELDQVLERGLMVGLNGIMTFTKNSAQLSAAKSIPLDHLLLETDAPFLTPVPFRGTICQPKHVRVVAEFLAQLRHEPLETLAAATTANAAKLFNLD